MSYLMCDLGHGGVFALEPGLDAVTAGRTSLLTLLDAQQGHSLLCRTSLGVSHTLMRRLLQL